MLSCAIIAPLGIRKLLVWESEFATLTGVSGLSGEPLSQDCFRAMEVPFLFLPGL